MRARTPEQYCEKYWRNGRDRLDKWWRHIGTWKYRRRFQYAPKFTKRNHFALKRRRKRYGTLLPCRLPETTGAEG